jgi:16S rRNA (adenine1518-N6/adenine1519-N6)-dimethyltransferase
MIFGKSGWSLKDEASTSVDEPVRSTWRETFNELGLTPSKARGQNFLHDRRIVERIVEAASISRCDTVLEIGPGLGVMTAELARRAQRVVAIEIDYRLAEHLRERMPENVSIVEGDALKVDFATLTGSEYIVVANLPYSVATAIIRKLQESDPPPSTLTVMVQREVAERMCAAPPNMSILAVGVQFYGDPRLLFRVGGGAFVPAPKVESAVVRIVTREMPLPRAEWEAFFRIVAAGFSGKRKQLRGALTARLGLHRSVVAEALGRAGVRPEARAETLTVDDWVQLYRALACESP